MTGRREVSAPPHFGNWTLNPAKVRLSSGSAEKTAASVSAKGSRYERSSRRRTDQRDDAQKPRPLVFTLMPFFPFAPSISTSSTASPTKASSDECRDRIEW